ncbi:uncharacterized protein [Eurosta solidaginis]|uniref:uncharacterized protein n=1 Tax=Eurosta solidaginis TaxID=178769 RepID=UPI003531103C
MTSTKCLENITVTKASNKQNFVIKDKKAYTDNVLVHNIFVYGIPKKFTEDNVRRYFTIFGEVASVRLVADKNKSMEAAPKVGFVKFNDPVSACRALVKTNHCLQGSRIGVKASHSWHQPDADKKLGRMQRCNMASCSKKRKEKNEQGPANIASESQVGEVATATAAKLNDDFNDIWANGWLEDDEDFYVGDEDFYVGDEDFYVGDEDFYVGDEDFYVGDEDFYVEDDVDFYVEDDLDFYVEDNEDFYVEDNEDFYVDEDAIMDDDL